MVYFFGTGSNLKVVFGGRNLTEAEKAEASLVLENLPPMQSPEGKRGKFYVDPVTKEFSYIFEDVE